MENIKIIIETKKKKYIFDGDGAELIELIKSVTCNYVIEKDEEKVITLLKTENVILGEYDEMFGYYYEIIL